MGCIILFPLQRGGQRLQGGLQYKLLKASNNTAFCTSLCKDGVCTLTTLTTPTTLTEDVSAVFEIVISASPSRSPGMKAGNLCRLPHAWCSEDLCREL